MKVFGAILVAIALVAPAIAQHPFIKPELDSARAARADRDPDPVAPDTAEPDELPAELRDWRLYAKLAASVGVVLGSKHDYTESNRAIAEGRATELNGLVRGRDGRVSGWKKAGYTAAEQIGSWWLYVSGKKVLAILVDGGVAIAFWQLGQRAEHIGR